MKKKLKNIINGYKNLIITDEIFEPLYEKRHEICKSCEMNIGGLCRSCLCVVASKSRALDEECPSNKWFPILLQDEEGEYFYKEELPDNLQKYFENDIITIEEWIIFKNSINK